MHGCAKLSRGHSSGGEMQRLVKAICLDRAACDTGAEVKGAVQETAREDIKSVVDLAVIGRGRDIGEQAMH